jgi:hypothetical protein
MSVRSWWGGRFTQPYMRPERSRSSQMAHSAVDGLSRSLSKIAAIVAFVGALLGIIAFFKH